MKQQPAPHITLRPHHLLCIPHFTGHGYNAAFTEHMTALTEALASHPETTVTLTRSCDDLCAACPHNSGGVCASQEKVTKLDSAVLDVCRFPPDRTLSWQTLSETVRKHILQTDAFPRICAVCEWFGLCSRIHTDKELFK